MNDNVTILGRVGADPKRSETANGVAVVNFRVASPQRRFDSKTQTWIETGTFDKTQIALIVTGVLYAALGYSSRGTLFQGAKKK